MAAQAAANSIFRTQAIPVRQQFEAQRAAASNKAELRAASATYGTQMLPVTLERKAAMAQAKAAYVASLERARTQFLSDSGASTAVWAGARYEQALHLATSEYRIAVSTARSDYRRALTPLRTDMRSYLASATSQAEAEKARARFRLESADATGVLQLQIRQARDAYLTKVAIAKNQLRTAPH